MHTHLKRRGFALTHRMHVWLSFLMSSVSALMNTHTHTHTITHTHTLTRSHTHTNTLTHTHTHRALPANTAPPARAPSTTWQTTWLTLGTTPLPRTASACPASQAWSRLPSTCKLPCSLCLCLKALGRVGLHGHRIWEWLKDTQMVRSLGVLPSS